MSAKGRGTIVIPNEFYSTPEATIKALCNELELSQSERDSLTFGEPCIGEGHIQRVVTEELGIHLPWEWAELSKGRDYLTEGLTGAVDCIITNPPFSLASQFIDQSLEEASAGFTAYLLRLNFFGSRRRHDWWQGKEPTHLFTLSERPSFVDVCKGKKSAGIRPCKSSYRKEENRKICDCGGIVGAGTDATEYAWFVWDNAQLCKRDPGMYVI